MKKQLLSILGLVVILFFLSACGADGDNKEIKIGYQKQAIMLTLKNSEELQKELKDLGYTITWSEFSTGSSIIEALNSGSIDFANAGDMPSLFALAKGSDFQFIASEASAPESEGILVGKDSGINSLADLKGKKVAYNNASIAQYLLVKALATVDLTLEDITPVILTPPDASIAFEKGEVDAWVVWDPYMTVAESNGHKILQTGAGIVPLRSFYLSSEKMVTEHPELVEVIVKYLGEIGREIDEDPTDATKLMEKLTKVPADTWEISLKRKRTDIKFMDEEAVKDLETQAQDLLDIGLIENKINFEGKIWYPE
ncbi:MAG TPA: aliphatic sulfonate ABC transporter substrate-binding protein [Bacillaceae bacterium]|nr:aliphatic sulfonate ABC transporter substrate-binding protein [Bacillaceae bacterium]